MKKIICLLLCAVMLIPMLVSCSSNDPVTNDGTGVRDDGRDIQTFPGETYTILCREDNAYGTYLYEITADEGETELVNQAVYDRNQEVLTMTGLADIKAHAIPGDWANGDSFMNTFKNSINAGTGDFDLIMSHQAYMAEGSLAQYFYNIYDIKSIDLDAEYYYKDIIDEMTIDGQLKYLVGDYSLTYWDHAYVMYYNKQIHANNGLPDLYELVKNGEWTIDKCIELSRGIYQDTNNDQWDGPEDTYGYITDIPNTTDALHAQFDVQPTSRNEAGELVVSLDQNKMHSIIQKMTEFKATKDFHHEYTTSGEIAADNPLDLIFRESRALFYPATLSKAQEFRDIEVDFGIIPCPMWDENQYVTDKNGNYLGGYYTSAQDGYSVAVIPADVTNPEKSGTVFDALSYLSGEYVIPAYYDEALKLKYSRDDASAEMLDIIRQGFKVNFGIFYNLSINGIGHIFRTLLNQESPNFMSFYAVNQRGYENKLKELVETYRAGIAE